MDPVILSLGVLVVILVAVLSKSRINTKFLGGNNVEASSDKVTNNLKASGRGHKIVMGTRNNAAAVEKNNANVSGENHDIQQGGEHSSHK